jgi:tetratricopeptide (TPR) repeat protein
MANCLREMHDYQQAVEISNAALEIARSLSDRRTEADLLSILGRCYRDQGQLENATASFEHALQNYRALRVKIGEAVQLRNLSSVSIARSD